MSEVALDEPTVDDVLARRHGRCSKCDQPGGYRSTLLCKRCYEQLIYGNRKPKADKPAARKRKSIKPRKPQTLAPQVERRRLAAMVARAVAQGGGEPVARLDRKLGFKRGTPRLQGAIGAAEAEGWIKRIDGRGFVPGAVSAPEPAAVVAEAAEAKPPRVSDEQRAAGRAAHAAALQRQREQREAAVAALADRIAGYVAEHGPAQAAALAAALNVSPQSQRWKAAVKAVKARGIDPFDARAAEVARLVDAIPAALASGAKTADALAAELEARKHHVREACAALRERGVVDSSRAAGYWLSDPSSADDTAA